MDVLFKEGDYVEAGSCSFGSTRDSSSAAVDQARATLAQATRRRPKPRARTTSDIARSPTRDTSAGRRPISSTRRRSVQAATVQADRAALRGAEVNLGFTTIRAPISGRTGTLLVRRGNNVSPTTGPLVVINQISPVLVRFPVLSQDFTTVQRVAGVAPARRRRRRERLRGNERARRAPVPEQRGRLADRHGHGPSDVRRTRDAGCGRASSLFLTIRLERAARRARRSDRGGSHRPARHLRLRRRRRRARRRRARSRSRSRSTA